MEHVVLASVRSNWNGSRKRRATGNITWFRATAQASFPSNCLCPVHIRSRQVFASSAESVYTGSAGLHPGPRVETGSEEARWMRTRLTADWVIGHEGGQHCLIEQGEVVYQDARIIFVGHDFPGEVDVTHDSGKALIAPGFIDLDALADLDTTILAFDNQPGWKKGRVWPRTYMDRGPYEMYSADELIFQKRYAFSQLLRNGITTAAPIASLFYREWGETSDEFAAAADIAGELGLRVYLGPAYRSGNQVIDANETIGAYFNEARGFAGLEAAIAFCQAQEGRHDDLVRTMLAPDRIETCTSELLRRTAAAAQELDVPVRLHCCQSKIEYDMVVAQHGLSPPEWLDSLGFLSPRVLLPHATWVSGSRGIDRSGRDLDIIAASGATIVHCPLVSARGGRALDSFASYRRRGLRIGMGTDTWPPDMVLNLQLGLLLSRVMDGDAASPRAEDLFDAATIGGADALGRADLGRLMPDAQADIVVFDFSHDRMGPTIDPIQTLLISASGRDVRHVVVAGRMVVVDGAIPGLDMRDASQRAQAQFGGLIARYPERTLGHPPVGEIFASSYPVRRR
jgi:cytosine/adenosine deaminase-related metal-dependent hydrolase